MKIKFNGVLEKKTSGCGACGSRTVNGYAFVTTKSYILPSGINKTFKVGVIEDVADIDGQFLLGYIYDDENGDRRAIFEEVK